VSYIEFLEEIFNHSPLKKKKKKKKSNSENPQLSWERTAEEFGL
jgi:hypothetical protein